MSFHDMMSMSKAEEKRDPLGRLTITDLYPAHLPSRLPVLCSTRSHARSLITELKLGIPFTVPDRPLFPVSDGTQIDVQLLLFRWDLHLRLDYPFSRQTVAIQQEDHDRYTQHDQSDHQKTHASRCFPYLKSPETTMSPQLLLQFSQKSTQDSCTHSNASNYFGSPFAYEAPGPDAFR